MEKPSLSPEDIPIRDSIRGGAVAINPLDAIRLLRPVSGELFDQLVLYRQLVGVEWEEQKVRLLKMLACTLIGFSSLLCVMLAVGILVVALSWESPYRIQAISAMIAIYAVSVGFAWVHFSSLSVLGRQAFAATREEFAADIALLRSRL